MNAARLVAGAFTESRQMPKRLISREVARARARLGGLTARGADPETLEQARAALIAANVKADAAKAAARQLVTIALTGGGDDAT